MKSEKSGEKNNENTCFFFCLKFFFTSFPSLFGGGREVEGEGGRGGEGLSHYHPD